LFNAASLILKGNPVDRGGRPAGEKLSGIATFSGPDRSVAVGKPQAFTAGRQR